MNTGTRITHQQAHRHYSFFLRIRLKRSCAPCQAFRSSIIRYSSSNVLRSRQYGAKSSINFFMYLSILNWVGIVPPAGSLARLTRRIQITQSSHGCDQESTPNSYHSQFPRRAPASNPNGILAQSPRLARQRLPWDLIPQMF